MLRDGTCSGVDVPALCSCFDIVAGVSCCCLTLVRRVLGWCWWYVLVDDWMKVSCSGEQNAIAR